jgi:hypothetical protein
VVAPESRDDEQAEAFAAAEQPRLEHQARAVGAEARVRVAGVPRRQQPPLAAAAVDQAQLHDASDDRRVADRRQ